jgi:hypothetical protein
LFLNFASSVRQGSQALPYFRSKRVNSALCSF